MLAFSINIVLVKTVLTVTPNSVKEIQLTNLNSNLNTYYFTKSLKIVISRNGTSYIEWRHNKNKQPKFYKFICKTLGMMKI